MTFTNNLPLKTHEYIKLILEKPTVLHRTFEFGKCINNSRMPHIQIQQSENLPNHQVSILIMAKTVVLKYNPCEYAFLIHINSAFCMHKHQMTTERQLEGLTLPEGRGTASFHPSSSWTWSQTEKS